MKNAAGIVMSLTCAWRVVTGVWHLVFRRELRVDPITQMLSVLIVAKSRVEYVDPKVLSQCLSLLFIAFIVGASLRNFSTRRVPALLRRGRRRRVRVRHARTVHRRGAGVVFPLLRAAHQEHPAG